MNESNILTINTDRSSNPLCLYWAGKDNPMQLYTFSHITEWQDFISQLSLNCQLPKTIRNKFERAQNLYLLAWVNFDVIKAGELAALVALELALKDVYFSAYKQRFPKEEPLSFFRQGLEYMVKYGELTDEKLPIYQKSGGAVIANLYRKKQNQDKKKQKIDQTGTICGIRNSLAHGDPFDGMPWASLLEVVRDLIDYMYCNPPRIE